MAKQPPKSPAVRKEYNTLLSGISTLLERARRHAVRQLNTLIVQTYWNVGRYIREYEQEGRDRAQYGEGLLKRLSEDLTEKFGKGYTERNLRAMRQFYMLYQNWHTLGAESMTDEKRHTPGAESLNSQTTPGKKGEIALLQTSLSWSHFRVLMRIEEEEKRSFYEIETVKNSWSVRELKRQMDSMLYERIAMSRDKEGVESLARYGELIERPEDAIRDPYVLEFLGLKEKEIYTEKVLETALIDHLQDFLLEMGKGFTFVARQKRISLNNEHYYIDLVLFNRILKCLVLIDLKLGKFTHADAGQMNFYLNYVRKNEVIEDENPPIGLILCADKDDVFVEYSLGGLSNKIFASRYRLTLPSENELKELLKKERELLKFRFEDDTDA